MRATQFTKNIFTPPVLDEGVNDPAIFKVVFVIGGPGSGKSYITSKLGLGAMGFVPINSDHAFEYLMKKHSIDPKMPAHEKEKRDVVRQRAKEITANKSELAIDGRLGIVIDGTGDDYEKVATLKKNFDMLGYNNFLVVVNTKLDVARQRNQQRARTVPDEIVVQSWNDVQNNIGKFAQIFENVAIIDNSGTDSAETESQINNTYVKLQKFVAAEPNKPAARRWMERGMLSGQVIREYQRDKTGATLGDKLLDTIEKTSPDFLPDSLKATGILLGMIKNPGSRGQKAAQVDIFGRKVTLDPTNPEKLQNILNSIKPQIIDAVLAAIEASDPTQNKQYTQWLARMWAKGGVKFEDLNRMNYVGQYHKAKAKNFVPADKGDINRFKTYGEFEGWFHNSGIPQKLHDLEAKIQREREPARAEVVYEDNKVRVIVPKNIAASRKYGANTLWCTADRNPAGIKNFNDYTAVDNLYIIEPKKQKYRGEKYQFHFARSQFLDQDDEQVNLLSLMTKRFPGLLAFFKEEKPWWFKDMVEWGSDEELKKFIDLINQALQRLGKKEVDAAVAAGVDQGEIKKFKAIIAKLLRLTPNSLRTAADEVWGANHGSEARLNFANLPFLYEDLIRDSDEYLNSQNSELASDFANKIYGSIKIYNKEETGQETGSNMAELGTVGEWTVAVKNGGGKLLKELGKSAEYRNPIGIMEFYKFNQVASTEQKNLMKKLIGMKRYSEALTLLQDVTGVKIAEAESRTPASTEIRTAMRKHGYKLLGSGEDATVWAKKSGPVVKIIMPSDKRGAGVAGDTFMKFYQFCKEHQGFDNLPKFAEEEVSAFQAEGKNYIMVTMERLSPIPPGSINEALVWILSDLATKNVPWKEALKVIKDPETWVDYGGGLSPEEIIKTVDGYSRKKLLELEVIFNLMTLLYRRGRINKAGWDLHTENAMLRGDTIVITDPWFGQEIEGNG